MLDARDRDAYLRAIAEIGPTLEEEAEASERQARITDRALEALHEHRLFRAWIPRSLGGDELPLPDSLAAFEAVSRHDGAAGWTVMIGVGGGLFAAFMTREGAEEVFRPARAVIAGSGHPSGRAALSGDTYIASGRWAYSSGAHHATWFTANCIIEGQQGPARIRAMAFPASDVQIMPNWDTSGMRGTGSHDFAVEAARVPARRTFSVFTDQPRESGPLFRFPFESIAQAAFVPVATGIALRALDEFRTLASGKAVLGSTSGLLAQPGVGTRIAEATAILGSARSWHASVVADAWQLVVDGGELDAPARDLVALASIHAARSAARAVDLVHELAGTSVARMSSALGRCWRDVHVVASHVGLSPLSLEGIGQRAGSSESVRTPEHLHRAQDRR